MQLYTSYGIVPLSSPYYAEDINDLRFEITDPHRLLLAFDGGYPILQLLLKKGGSFYMLRRGKSTVVSRRDKFVNIIPTDHELQKLTLESLDKQADEEFILLRREVVALIEHLHTKEKYNVGE